MELKLADFVLYVIVSCFTLVPIFAIISRTLHARVENSALANRVVCRLCLHAFEDSSHVNTVHCPACGAVNEKGQSRRLG
jgi:hydrogenase maturation factor HypF (carbamoyltransferase family)